MLDPHTISHFSLHHSVGRIDDLLIPLQQGKAGADLSALEEGMNPDHLDGVVVLNLRYAADITQILLEMRIFLNALIEESDRVELEQYPLPWYEKEIEGVRYIVDGTTKPLIRLSDKEKSRVITEFILQRVNQL